MAKRYNVYFSGQVITGFDPLAVRESLGKVFNADAQTLDKLFSGKPRMIKRDCDEATAQKYRAAMEQAGAEPIIEAVDAPVAGSAADKIAALAAAPEDERFRQAADSEQNPDSAQDATPAASTPPKTQAEAGAKTLPTATATAGGDSDIELAPPETDVLLPEERAKPRVREVDTSSLSVDTSGERLAQPAPPPPAAPDTSHLDVGDVGEVIPNLPSTRAPVAPNTDGLGLSPEGTDFSDCANPAPPPPELDLSGMEVAPAGADVLEQKYRKPERTAAPDTDHISLED